MQIEVIDTRITDERLAEMEMHHYFDLRSAIAGFGIEDERRLFIFYIDGFCKVIEYSAIGSNTWRIILNAAKHGYGLEYLASKHVTWVTEDKDLRAIAYLDCLSHGKDL
ncbi:MAG: hypothetical protein Q4F99_05430 [bacterium]|nr:hypothetical protein [bacterium]